MNQSMAYFVMFRIFEYKTIILNRILIFEENQIKAQHIAENIVHII